MVNDFDRPQNQNSGLGIDNTFNKKFNNRVTIDHSKRFAIDTVAKSILGPQLAFMRSIEFAQNSAIGNISKSFSTSLMNYEELIGVSKHSAIDKVTQSLLGSPLGHMIFFESSKNTAIGNIAKSFLTPQIEYEKLLGLSNISSINQINNYFSDQKNYTAIKNAFQQLINTAELSDSLSTLAKPGFLSAAIQVMSETSSINLNEDYKEFSVYGSIVYGIKDLSEAEDVATFIEFFKKISKPIQRVLIFIFLYVFLNQLNSICANLLTPKVEQILKLGASKQDSIRAIKKIDTKQFIDNADSLRFVVRDKIRVRAKPDTKSTALDELSTGQIVVVLSKQRNWLEISYEYESGEILHGWILSKYTSKFKY